MLGRPSGGEYITSIPSGQFGTIFRLCKISVLLSEYCTL